MKISTALVNLCWLLLVITSLAKAETISGNLSSSAGEGPKQLLLPKFDSGLGVLLDASATVTWSSYNLVKLYGPFTGDVTKSVKLTATAPGGIWLGEQSLFVSSTHQELPLGTPYFVSVNDGGYGSFALDFAPLSITGLLTTESSNTLAITLAESDRILYPSGSENWSANFLANLSYTYIYAPVPEPRTLVLFVFGLSVLSVASQVTKKARVARAFR